MTRNLSTVAAGADIAPLSIRYELVRLDLIDVPKDRQRWPDPAWVDVVGKAMAEVGQLQPIRLTEGTKGRFELDFGLARLLAARQIGWTSIEAGIAAPGALNGLRRRLASLFENLIRQELTALDRALALAELKSIHEALYPEAKKGGDLKKKQRLSQPNEIFSFSSEAAERTGLSQRAIQISVAIVTGLRPESVERLRDTAFASHQASLIALSGLTASLQAAILDILLAKEPKASSVADALILARGERLPSADEKAWRTLNDSLTRATRKTRTAIYDRFEAEIREHGKARGWF